MYRELRAMMFPCHLIRLCWFEDVLQSLSASVYADILRLGWGMWDVLPILLG